MPRTVVKSSNEQMPDPAKIDQPAPDKLKASVQEQAEKFCEARREKYFDAIRLAAEAAATTQTHAWQENYAAQRKGHFTLIRAAAGRIMSVAENVRDGDTSEPDEKAIKDDLKMLAEERVEYEAWLERTVAPYEKPVKRVEELRDAAVAAASRKDEENPLIFAGFANAAAAIIRSWPTATWDPKTGVATVVDGVQAAVEEIAQV